VAETTTPLDRLVELLVYAPVGLALTLKDDLAGIVDLGRRTIAPQVQVARFMGRLAVARATRAAGDLVEDAIGRMASTAPGAPAQDAAEPPPPASYPAGNGSAGNGSAGPPSGTAPPEGEVFEEGEGLAIPGYDSLSAAHVVQRLGGLADAELEAVRRYEEAHRGRRTVLFKIDQLQAGQR
jgi:hypothetical protein